LIRKFKDLLTLGTLWGVTPTLWVLQGLRIVEFPGEITGATIVTWTLLFQYYFRKHYKKDS